MSCLHPIVMDMQRPPNGCLIDDGSDWWRLCALCDTSYNRTKKVLNVLRKQCERAWGIDFKRIKLSQRDAEGLYKWGS